MALAVDITIRFYYPLLLDLDQAMMKQILISQREHCPGKVVFFR